MASKIVLPAVVLFVALAFGSGDALQCYECMSVGTADDNCKPDIIMKDEGTKTTCTIDTMGAWYNKMREHPSLSVISKVFHVDVTGQTARDVPMSCVKMNLRVDNQPATLRTCQDTNTSGVDPCQSIQKKIMKEYSQHAVVDYCGLCEGPLCNGSYVLSPTMILSMVPLIGSILMSLMYNSA